MLPFKIEGRNVYYDDKLLEPLPTRLQKLLADLLEKGPEGINPDGYGGLKRKSVAANYVGDLRDWLMNADLPVRIINTTGPGTTWDPHVCPTCGHITHKRGAGKRGRYVLQAKPERSVRPREIDLVHRENL